MEVYAEPYINHEIVDFIKRRIRKSKNAECEGLVLFSAYKKWCREYNTLPKSRYKFYKALEREFLKTKNRKYGTMFLGVKLR